MDARECLISPVSCRKSDASGVIVFRYRCRFATLPSPGLYVPGELPYPAELVVALGEQVVGGNLAQFVKLFEDGFFELGDGRGMVLVCAAEGLGDNPVDQ